MARASEAYTPLNPDNTQLGSGPPYLLRGPSHPATGPQCYHCSERGHIARNGPLKKDPEEPMETGLMKGRVMWSGGKRPKYTLKVYLNDMERTALVDSGCSQSVIRQSLVLPEQRTPQTQVLIACVHGDQRLCPVAMVLLNWKGEDGTITVGVIPNLDEEIILSTDYINFTSLLEKASQEHVNNAWWDEAPFGASEIDVRTPKNKLSRKQKREQRREYQNVRDLENICPTLHTATVFTTAGDFRQAQHGDPTLKNAWHQAVHPDGQSPLARGSVCDVRRGVARPYLRLVPTLPGTAQFCKREQRIHKDFRHQGRSRDVGAWSRDPLKRRQTEKKVSAVAASRGAAQDDGMAKEDGLQEERLRTTVLKQRQPRRHNAGLPATLQEKRGRLRCVLGPLNGNQGGWKGERRGLGIEG
ncbi:hypothetical protein NDU88_001985 [Pleurodeles waltl]|uniref:Uncharacterized protein n=1 Tax=Pleurodeles waltl TaxID=8319 RepID=A0AAV7Q4N2_PLEWA|nr:hypothetical protein NDU88_001985 [Pleurodeles waltl]